MPLRPRRLSSPLSLVLGLVSGWVVLPGCTQEPIIARNQRGGVTVVQGTVGPRGASLRNGEVEVEFPPGALPVDTPVSIKKVPRGGTSLASLQPTALGVGEGCGKLRPQGDFLYSLEPKTLVFSKEVRVTISTLGNPDGPTALTLEGASTNGNGYAPSGRKATVRLWDFASSIDVQTLVPVMASSYAVSSDGTTCSALNGKGELTSCTPIPEQPGLYSCQGPLGLAATASVSSLAELQTLMAAIAIGQGSDCSGPPAPSTCGNGVRDGAELCDGADLGGATCDAVLPGTTGTLACDAACQLTTANCTPASTCGNGVRDGAEVCDGADLGGQTCADLLGASATGVLACDPACQLDSSNCAAAPGCVDGVQNGTETAVDCGGVDCVPCADGLACQVPADCTSGSCVNLVCQAPTCFDQALNGDETDMDCGGSCPSPCGDGATCAIAADCLSGVCTGNVCTAASCTDGVQNDLESDVDCGEGCAPCGDGLACGVPADCLSGICTGNVCAAASCTDGVKNGTETDVDCGGSCPACVTILFAASNAIKTELGSLKPGGAPTLLTEPFGSLCVPSISFPSVSAGALAVIGQDDNGGANHGLIKYATWTDGTGWTSLQDVPTLPRTSDTVFLSHRSPDTHASYVDNQGLKYALFNGVTWTQPGIPTGALGSTSPSILATPGKIDIAFFDGQFNNASATQTTADPLVSWDEPISTPGISAVSVSTSPVLIPMEGGSHDALLCVIGLPSSFHCWGRLGGIWDQTVVPTFTPPIDYSRQFAMASLPGNEAILIYADPNNDLHYSIRQSDGFWSATAPVGAQSFNPPSVVRGVGGATAELGYTTPDGTARHVRLINGSWVNPTDLAFTVGRIAIAAR
jgi:hypothetical protein